VKQQTVGARIMTNALATNHEVVDDPRFIRGVAFFDDGDYLEASDLFEELFFEGVRDEPDFIRVFLQFSVGIYHAQCGQWRPAVERIEEGIRLAATIQNDRMIDLSELAACMKAGVTAVRENRRPHWPAICRRNAQGT
jgi:predicted metal-dependent hydrolase